MLCYVTRSGGGVMEEWPSSYLITLLPLIRLPGWILGRKTSVRMSCYATV